MPVGDPGFDASFWLGYWEVHWSAVAVSPFERGKIRHDETSNCKLHANGQPGQAPIPSQNKTQTFFTLRNVFANINQTFIEDFYAVF